MASKMVIEETDIGISWIVRLCALFTTLGAFVPLH